MRGTPNRAVLTALVLSCVLGVLFATLIVGCTYHAPSTSQEQTAASPADGATPADAAPVPSGAARPPEEAEAKAKGAARYLRELKAGQIKGLFRQAEDMYVSQRYDEAESAVRAILSLDPDNGEAKVMLDQVDRGRSRLAFVELNEQRAREYREHWEATQEASRIQGGGQTIVYPPDWKEMSRRREEMLATQRPEVSAAEAAVRDKLQRQVTFSFADTPLEDVADFLRRVGDVNIVVDQRVLATVGPGGYRVSLALTDVPLEDALDFILDLVDLDWVIRRGVVFISDVQGVQAEAFMRIYDVRDIIGQVSDFAGPGFDVEAPGRPPRAEVDEEEVKAAQEKAEALIKRIQEEVEPETWKVGRNSIVHRQGTLIIRNAYDVHQKIQRLLQERRQSSLFSLRPVTEPGKSYAEKMVDLRTDQEVWLSETCIVSAASLVPKPEVSVRLQPGQPAAIEVEITADAASRLAQWTKAHVRQQMAVVCDGEVWSVPTVAAPIASEKISIVAPDAERAQRFATKLQEYFDRRLKERRRSP